MTIGFTFVIEGGLVEWLYGQAHAERWRVPPEAWAGALYVSASRAFQDAAPSRADLERYLKSLHVEDLALACACAAGNDAAWEHFVREQRPALYRAADALDATGDAREIADALYADLYGFADGHAERQSLFRYFHGRSRLSTWLRAVLSQRYIDRMRAARRLEPLPEDDSPEAIATPGGVEPDRERFVRVLERALRTALDALTPRDRLRLACYYAQGLTLAETGRLLNEHEATVSRQLSRTRRRLRVSVERWLREDAHLTADAMAACFASVARDSGPIDLDMLLSETNEEEVPTRRESARTGKKLTPDRSE
jgi:RNA polymerase sigma-70 factor (ECF subfamily)